MRRRFMNKKSSTWQYFYIEALEDGVSFTFTEELEYKINKGNWVSLPANDESESIKKGSRVFLRGSYSISPLTIQKFSINGSCKIGGDVKSLTYKEQAKNISKVVYRHFESLFEGCTTIKEVDKDLLTATELGDSCYASMFRGCTGLTQAPELPATTLASDCYYSMFDGCTNLRYIKALFTTKPSSVYTYKLVYGVASAGTFVKSKDATWDVTGVNGVPEGWTVITDTFPTNDEGFPENTEFGFPLYINFPKEPDYTDDSYEEYYLSNSITISFASWLGNNAGNLTEQINSNPIFINGFRVTGITNFSGVYTLVLSHLIFSNLEIDVQGNLVGFIDK